MAVTSTVPARESRVNEFAENRAFFVLMAVVCALIVGAAIGKGLFLMGGPAAPSGPSPFAYEQVRPAPALALIDQDERPFDFASLRGTPAFVFFGYTHCPDICPTTIGSLNEVLKERDGAVRIVFVTVDPERDTPAFLREYMRYMPPGYVTLTGSAAQVRTAADAWGVRYEREETGSADGYAVAHTVKVYLVDGQGDLRARYPFGTPPQAMIDDIDRLANEAHS